MINIGDTAWFLISTALVMLMTQGLAFFLRGDGQAKKYFRRTDVVFHNFMRFKYSMGAFWI